MNCGTKSRAWCNYKVVGGSERGGGGRWGKRWRTKRENIGARYKGIQGGEGSGGVGHIKASTDCRALASTFRACSRLRVRALMHALSSRERERRAASGRASTRRELRFRSNRCALSAACVRSPRTCMRAHVRAPSHTRAFSLHSSSLHGKDNVAASFRTPWNDRVATVSVQRFLLPSFSLFFSSFFNLPPPPPPRFSSYIEASDSHSRDASRKELEHNEFGRNILGILTRNFLASRESWLPTITREIPETVDGCHVDEYLNIFADGSRSLVLSVD